MKDRLAPIDWKSIIEKGEKWLDPTFKTDVNSILDPHMMRPNRIRNWENLAWKRPE